MCSKEHIISILQKPQESQHYIIYWETEIWKSFEKDLNNCQNPNGTCIKSQSFWHRSSIT